MVKPTSSSLLSQITALRKGAAAASGRTRRERRTINIAKRINKENASSLRERCKVVSVNAVTRVEKAVGVNRGCNLLRIALAIQTQEIAEQIVSKAVYNMLYMKRQTILAEDIAHGYRATTRQIWAGPNAPVLPYVPTSKPRAAPDTGDAIVLSVQ